MPLKTLLKEEDVTALPDELREYYTQDGDHYVLDLDGIDEHPKVTALRNGHQRSKQERDEARQALRDAKQRFGGLLDEEELDLSHVDLDILRELLPVLAGEQPIPKPGEPGKDVDIDKIKTNARKPLERDLQAAVQRAEIAEKQLRNLVADSALASAVAETRITGPYAKAVKAMFKGQIKVVEGDDGQPVAVIDSEYGEQPVGKFLKEWSQSDEGLAFVAAGDNDGGGVRHTKPNGGKLKNPWAKDSWSVAEQSRIYKEMGADTARRMAAEHGKTVL